MKLKQIMLEKRKLALLWGKKTSGKSISDWVCGISSKSLGILEHRYTQAVHRVLLVDRWLIRSWPPSGVEKHGKNVFFLLSSKQQ